MRYKDVRPHTIFVDQSNGPCTHIDTLNFPNYTGSTGFGEFYVQKLIGKCGTLDVQDVKATVDLLVKEGKGEYGPGKQFVIGGSHGGFLTAHRECNYPIQAFSV
jgi:acylaminoacyl-peptidase